MDPLILSPQEPEAQRKVTCSRSKTANSGRSQGQSRTVKLVLSPEATEQPGQVWRGHKQGWLEDREQAKKAATEKAIPHAPCSSVPPAET